MELLLALVIYAFYALAFAALVVQLLTSPLWLPTGLLVLAGARGMLLARKQYLRLKGALAR